MSVQVRVVPAFAQFQVPAPLVAEAETYVVFVGSVIVTVTLGPAGTTLVFERPTVNVTLEPAAIGFGAPLFVTESVVVMFKVTDAEAVTAPPFELPWAVALIVGRVGLAFTL